MQSLNSLLLDASYFVQSEFNLQLQQSQLKPYSFENWQKFCQINDFDVNSEGLYVPASYSAYVRTNSPFLISNIFHELYALKNNSYGSFQFVKNYYTILISISDELTRFIVFIWLNLLNPNFCFQQIFFKSVLLYQIFTFHFKNIHFLIFRR